MFKGKLALLNNYAGAIAIACTFMYIRVLFEAAVISKKVALFLLPSYALASFFGLIYSYFLYKNSKEQKLQIESESLNKNPLQLSEALKFGLLFGVIYGAISLVEGKFGNSGIYAVSFISGISDVDAITLSLSQLFNDAKIPLNASAYGIIIASATNSLVKLAIIYYLGGIKLGNRLALFFTVTLTALIGEIFIIKL